jgi:signal transduction histidine kinase
MTRRILVALLALIIATVCGAMVPVAMNAASHDRSSFISEEEDALKVYAALETPVESSHTVGNAAVLDVPHQLEQEGSSLSVFQLSVPSRYLNWGMNKRLTRQQMQVLSNEAFNAEKANGYVPSPIFQIVGKWAVVGVGINLNADSPGKPIAVVLLAQPSSPLTSEIRTIWTILIAVGVAGLMAAALIAVWLARWASKPLAGLDTVARRLADGDLSVRAKPDYGPPEVRRLARTFNTMAGRLENLVHGSRAVLADVSHQLRTPLAALRLRLDFLAAEAAETDPDMAAELNGAQDELTRLSRLVDGLLAVARAENVQPQPKVIDVAEVAEERVAAWLPVAEDRGIFLAATYDAPVRGWLGEGHLEQVLDNLIDNALDALSAGDRIELSASSTESGVRVTVRDDGPGMTPEMRERAFLRFTSNSPGGTGIGLAIVQRLVTANGGTAQLLDSPGGGLTVLLDFPSAGGDAEVETTAMGKTMENPAQSTVGNAKITR